MTAFNVEDQTSTILSPVPDSPRSFPDIQVVNGRVFGLLPDNRIPVWDPRSTSDLQPSANSELNHVHFESRFWIRIQDFRSDLQVMPGVHNLPSRPGLGVGQGPLAELRLQLEGFSSSHQTLQHPRNRVHSQPFRRRLHHISIQIYVFRGRHEDEQERARQTENLRTDNLRLESPQISVEVQNNSDPHHHFRQQEDHDLRLCLLKEKRTENFNSSPRDTLSLPLHSKIFI